MLGRTRRLVVFDVGSYLTFSLLTFGLSTFNPSTLSPSTFGR
jgi:hypothetical protein